MRCSNAYGNRNVNKTKKWLASRCSSTDSAIKPRRPPRCRAESSSSRRSCQSRCPRTQAHPLHVPHLSEERAHRARAETCQEGIRRSHRFPRSDVTRRARGSNCARRTKRRRQVDTHADSVWRRSTRRRLSRGGSSGCRGVFRSDEATRLNPTLTVYGTLEAGSPNNMVPAIRTILGGFLFSGDDVFKKAAVLSGGERTRLAVARSCCVRRTRCCSTSRPTTSISTRRMCSSKRSRTTAGP